MIKEYYTKEWRDAYRKSNEYAYRRLGKAIRNCKREIWKVFEPAIRGMCCWLESKLNAKNKTKV